MQARRGHLSHKVPNVKLRPAPAQRSSRAEPEVAAYIPDDDDDDDERGASGLSGSKPWEKVVITFTGVDDKPHLSSLVKELGGQVDSALTINVTHVVASGFQSAKYNYAIEHGLPVMKPSWITDVHASWLSGDDPMGEGQESISPWRLQPFEGLKITISGFENLERRRAMISHINDNGGVYSKDLDRTCTHLISAKITSDSKTSEKVKWAVNQNKERTIAKRRSGKKDIETIRIVYQEWLWDSIAFKGRFNEDDYDASKARKQGRVKAEDVLDGTVVVITEPHGQVAEAEPEQEPAVLRKRKRDMDNLVVEIISTSGASTRQRTDDTADPVKIKPRESDIEMITSARRSSSPPKRRRLPTETDIIKTDSPSVEKKFSLLHLSRDTAFSSPTAAQQGQPTIGITDPAGPIIGMTGQSDAVPTQQFFEGLRFAIRIDLDCELLKRTLIQHGGVVITEDERLSGSKVDYIIVRLNAPLDPAIAENRGDAIVVTSCWVEGCCFEERVMDPNDQIVFKPLSIKLPIHNADHLNVHLSGWNTAQSMYLKRILKVIGGRLSLKLNRQTTHLVCPLADSIKAKRGPEWGVMVVKDTWLLAMAKSGQIEDPLKHRLPGTTLPLKPSTGISSSTKPMNPLRKLAGRVDSPSINDMSMVSELGEPTYGPALNSPQSNMSGSPARGLRPSATHTNEKSIMSTGFTTSLVTQDDMDPKSNILSPPKGQTERILNQASSTVLPAADESVKSKLPKASSAPNIESLRQSSATSTGHPLRSSSTSGASGHLASSENGAGEGSARDQSRKDVSEMLKKFTEGVDMPVSRTRPQRRVRNLAGPRKSGLTTGLSSFGHEMSPGLDTDSPFEPATPMEDPAEAEPEESIGVAYIDPQSERERKKLLDAVRKSDKAHKAALEREATGSPSSVASSRSGRARGNTSPSKSVRPSPLKRSRVA